MTHIEQVRPLDPYRVQIDMHNGSSLCLNLKDKLSQIRFALLNNPNTFKNVTTDGHFIRWGDELELSIHEVFQIAQH